MGSKYIVRQPIKDAAGEILGYEILYHGENQAFIGDAGAANEFAAADTIYNFLTQNSTKSLKGSLNFMTFTTMLLMKKTPRLFDKSELVIQIDDSVIIHPLSMHFVNQYAREGYKIAANEFQFAPRYLTLLDSLDYIKLNSKTTTDAAMHNIIDIAHSMHKKCIVTNIETEEQYQKAVALGADAMEGTHVAEKLTTKAHSGAYLQSNFFRLMVAVTKDEPDVNEIEQMISMDASLSFALLKQWIYLLSVGGTDNQMDVGAEEFLKLSFMRANFCSELMKYAQDMPVSRSEAYLMGMFSTLNYLIDAPLEEILNEVPIAEEIKAALLRKEGRCGKLYDLVLSYEAANWNKISSLAEELGIPNQVLTSVYFICMENVNMLWEQLNHPYVGQEQPGESTPEESQ